ncbi:putative rhamnosyl transferase [Primorskyibacter sp. S87]|uniref:putative rhamnosyl transferase n=1 Tax=Primorskyibacter sp. S87 TaxID=3415126 RepID=UPI003C7DF475
MQVIGLCRFSYPAIGGFQVQHATSGERSAYLYQPARMEERFRLFEAVALPCLRHQTDPDFTMLLLVGNDLPASYLQRLGDLVSDFPQIQILSRPPDEHRPVMKELLNEARHDIARPCLQFRFDDDDAISVDFVERLRQVARDCAPLLEQSGTVAIDFNRGFNARFDAGGIQASEEVVRPYFTAALGIAIRGNCKLSVMNFAHHKVHRFMPTVTFSDSPMWVRSHNGFNDSRQGAVKPVEMTPATPELEGEFSARFAIEASKVRQVFASA